MSKLNILFMGTPDIAVSCLDMLVKRVDVFVSAVVTQEDKPKGRGYKMLPPPVKEYAVNHNIPIYQPVNLKSENFSEILDILNPDLIVVVAYGKILPKYVLDYPQKGCINVHASILPKYRGPAPIQWAVLNGDKETGVTTMFMDEGVDTGDMLVTKKIMLDEFETSGTLFEKMMIDGAKALSETIDKIIDNTLVRIPQNHNEMSYAPMITKEFSYIDWSEPAQKITCLIKGLNPTPGAKTFLNGKILKIFLAKTTDLKNTNPAGSLCSENNKLFVTCGDLNMIEILELQPEGKKKMTAQDFLKGNMVSGTVILGNN